MLKWETESSLKQMEVNAVNVAAAATAVAVCLATALAATIYARFFMRRKGEPPLVSG